MNGQVLRCISNKSELQVFAVGTIEFKQAVLLTHAPAGAARIAAMNGNTGHRLFCKSVNDLSAYGFLCRSAQGEQKEKQQGQLMKT